MKLFHPTICPEAIQEHEASAEELLDGLLAGMEHAANTFRQYPTPDNWLAWIQAHAAWRVAFLAEEDKEGKP